LVGAAGVLVQEENLGDGEDDLQPELGAAPSSPTMSLDVVSKTEVLGDNHPLHSLTDDLIGGTEHLEAFFGCFFLGVIRWLLNPTSEPELPKQPKHIFGQQLQNP
jgi:hypothetical protein